MIIVSVKAPPPPPKCTCSVVADAPPPTTIPEVKAEVSPPLPVTVAPEVTVIATWNDRGIEVQVT